MDTKAYLASLNDQALLRMIEEAKQDLEKASRDDPESEWHQACFAGVICLANEAGKRGLTIRNSTSRSV